MILNEFEFQVAGIKLHGQYYSPQLVKAVVLLVHGLGEHSKRYERTVVPFLTKNSIAVISFDQFGHGNTKGKRGHHPGYSFLLDAIDQMISKAGNLFPEQPIFLYGHSMGGNIAINYCLQRNNRIKGLIATSPFLRLAFKPPAWKMALAGILDKIMPSITLPSDLDVNAISRDKSEIDAYELDPLVHDRVSTGYSLEIMKQGEWAIEHAPKMKIPMLLMHGTNDRLTSHLASEEFASKAGDTVEIVLFNGGFHELHHDLEKEKMLEKLRRWIESQIQNSK